MSECEVMQGLWKDKIEQLKQKREEKGEKFKIPSTDEMIENAKSHIPEMGDVLADTKSDGNDNEISEKKELSDGLE